MSGSATPPVSEFIPGALVRQPFRLTNVSDLPRSVETEFEKPRGLVETEVRRGFTLFAVSGIKDPLSTHLIPVLEGLDQANVSIDFLKLGADGMSFVVPESKCAEASAALTKAQVKFRMTEGRCVISVSSANLRDEEGLAASFVSALIASGTHLDHVSDMHDRVLFLIDSGDADRAVAALESFKVGGIA